MDMTSLQRAGADRVGTRTTHTHCSRCYVTSKQKVWHVVFILEVIVLPLRRFPWVSAKVGIFSVGIRVYLVPSARAAHGAQCCNLIYVLWLSASSHPTFIITKFRSVLVWWKNNDSPILKYWVLDARLFVRNKLASRERKKIMTEYTVSL